ncbi:MAG TPA: MFS transporter [Terracidiphilus sp.]
MKLHQTTTQHIASSGEIANPARFAQAAAFRKQRWQVVGAVVTISFLTILARAGISAAKAPMARDLRINDVSFGLVFGAFALGYAVFMLPCGLLADRWGPRKSLAVSVFFWSLFTLLTGLVSGVVLLISIRFFFGLAEAGVYPQATRALYNWMLPRERGLALGLLNIGSRLGAAFGLAATPFFIEQLGWRRSFVLLGIFGAVWAAIWFLWFHDKPDFPPASKDVNARSIAPKSGAAKLAIPLQEFLSSHNFYLILYQYFASQFTFFICLSWLLPFLKSRYAISTAQAGLYAGIPLCCGALAMWGGGSMVDRIFKSGRWQLSRSLPAMVGFGLAAVALLPAPFMQTPETFILCFALTTAGVDLAISPSWTVCCDVGGSYSGTLSAAMNTMGAMGSLASSLLFPILMGWTGDIKVYFGVAAILNVIAMVCWKYIDPSRSLLASDSLIRSGATIEPIESCMPEYVDTL